MRWQGESGSDNVEDRRGLGGGGAGLIGGGIGTVVIAVIVMLFGGDPSAILGSSGVGTPTEYRQTSSQEDEVARFSSVVFKFTEETWGEIFQENGMQYRPARMVLFTGATRTQCGVGQAAMGPFYCPADETVYMDLSFFQELKHKFGAQGGDFAIAYVIAHEVGHHIQTLLGTTQKVDALRRSGQYPEAELNRVSVATELQADFYAGVWARRTQERRNVLEAGDIEEAISAAEAVGDDRIQTRSQGYVQQESFTHGTSAQRKEWFMRGFNTGDIRQGNTFDHLLR